MVLNSAKYRELVSRELAKESNRRRVAKHRASKAAGNGVVTDANETVTLSEADTEADTTAKTSTRARSRAIS
jgi:hypothetical protein